MSSLINVNNKKWLSDETSDEEELFRHCREMEYVCYAVTRVILDAETKWRASSDSHMSLSNRSYILGLVNIQVLDQTIEYLSKLVKSFYKLNPKLARLKKDDPLLASKHDHIFDRLCSKRFNLLQSIYGLIMIILNNCLHRDDARKMIESCLSLISVYNQLIGLSYKKFAAKFNICSNTYPSIISETKTITLTKIVQVLSKSRVEINCHRLINCLVKIYKPDDHSENDTSSSTSGSLEIYHTLTKHITPPNSASSRQMTVEKKREAFIENKKARMKQCKSLIDIKNEQNKQLIDIASGQNSDSDVPYASLLNNECVLENIYNNGESINGILQSEEMYIEILLDTVANMAPNLLGNDGVRKLKNGRVQASKRAARKVTEHYQNALWGDVGGCLEHVVLWWAACPLATRSPNTSQNLREWLMTFNVNNTPDLILSAMRILADALGCHVTSTLWDKHFGATLTTNLKPTSMKQHPDLSLYITECTESGAHFALMLQQLTTLSNQCEVTGDYILGAPLEELPIVEQIPILHRLDHSIHTYRLWCLAETRRLANMWAMDDFFRITQNDMQACMEQLVNLRFADHTITIESGKIGVHENVCAKMREKLVSEVKVNIVKLKEAGAEVVAVLAAVCATSSLALLTLVFPRGSAWRRAPPAAAAPAAYVYDFLDKMLLPVIKATEDISRLNMVLRIMCESWLHHIYVAKIKFSKEAAVQLLADFDQVRNWLNECKSLNNIARKQMLQNEVLRRCEGVGRLLLHAPGDLISMQDSTMQSTQRMRKDENSDAAEQLMPAEMYVPNQKQWLTLRAKKLKGPLAFSLCCIVLC